MSSTLPDLIVTALPAQPARIVLPVVDAGGVLTAFGQPSSGVLVLNPDQSFTYTPATNFLGSDEFTYSALNADGDVDGRIVVQVHVANADPIAEPSRMARRGAPSGSATQLMKMGTVSILSIPPTSSCNGWTKP